MKSHLAITMDVYDGVLLDASHTWPQSIASFRRDGIRLRREASNRGLKFFTITLPSLGKVFDLSLEHGIFLATMVPQGVPLIKKRPELFGDLYLKIFDNDGKLREDPDITAIAFFRQLCYLAKSLKITCDPDKVEDAVSDFIKTDQNLPRPRPDTWDSDIPVWTPINGHPLGKEGDGFIPSGILPLWSTPLPWESLKVLSFKMISSLGRVDWYDLEPKHGPGAVSEKGWGVKYDFPNWPRKLGLWFPYDWFGSGNLDVPTYSPSEVEPSSRLIAVPKSQKGPRLICAEPIAHQWIQQSIWRWLEGRLRHSPMGKAINFRNQEASRMRALSSSLDRSHATVDLSSASDRLSCRLVEYLFQGNDLLNGFHACRTRMVRQEIVPSLDHTIRLRKFSTQGSALTFPVQSICFLILSVWALRLSEGRASDTTGWEHDCSRITVFGDDIIIPNSAYGVLKLVLHECGLKVNSEKSFSKGFFRESCGMDAYKGVDVTPAHLLQPYTDTPEAIVSVLESANNFHIRGYWNAASKLIHQIPEKERKLLPFLKVTLDLRRGSRFDGTSGSLGLLSFCGNQVSHLKTRFNPNLHHKECRALCVTSKVSREFGRGDSRLSQFFFEDPADQFHWEAGRAGNVVLGKRAAWVSDLTTEGS